MVAASIRNHWVIGIVSVQISTVEESQRHTLRIAGRAIVVWAEAAVERDATIYFTLGLAAPRSENIATTDAARPPA